MKLKSLLVALSELEIDKKSFSKTNFNINFITDDSRSVKKDSLFVACKGLNYDGHKFISEAIDKGARVVVGEKNKSVLNLKKSVIYIRVNNSRRALGLLASAFYGNPSGNLKVIGVTGTDGKTTTASLIHHILSQSGKRVGLVTTVSAKIGNKEIDTGFHVTSPDPVTLNMILRDMVRAKCEYAVIEVTSHGLEQGRVSGVDFDAAVMTNLTHEHLDYHKTFEDYRDAKAKLIKSVKKITVLNKDDESYEFFKSLTPLGTQVLSYSIKSKVASVYSQNIKDIEEGTSFEVVDGVQSYSLETNLMGEYNISNILAALTCCRYYVIEPDVIKKALKTFKAPKGRLEKIENNKGLEIYIDFAHTPNSLENVLKLLRRKADSKQKKGKLIAVFGCAGERDIDKRSMMGEISAKYADISIFTAEDPRSEKVESIIDQIIKGAKKFGVKKLKGISEVAEWTPRMVDSMKKHLYESIPERGEAIALAIQKLAKKGDTVVIFGKGHEQSMAYDKIEHPWSDQEAVRIALKGGVKEIKRPNL